MPLADMPDKMTAVRGFANAIAAARDCDLILYNWGVLPPADTFLIEQVAKRQRRSNVVLFLTTEGGVADSAFRIMRCLQSNYDKVTVAVNGWCKSAGTLMCIGAHELLIGPTGELGPLDVQITKVDEIDEQKSGLVAEAAFEKLQQEAYKLFMAFVRDIGGSEYRVTLKTASDLATKLTIGVFEPIFDKLDPVTIGEDYRSNRLALAYAERLNLHAKNLRRERDFDALTNLLSGYPSHGFVIDKTEADQLFKIVKPFPEEMVGIVEALGADIVWPRSPRQDGSPLLEYMNDEPNTADGQGAAADGHTAAEHVGGGNGPDELQGNPEEGGHTEQGPTE
jgi:hypothetical protein